MASEMPKNQPGTARCSCGQTYEHSTGVLEDPRLGRYQIEFHDDSNPCNTISWYDMNRTDRFEFPSARPERE